MSDLLNIGASAIRAYSSSLAAVSDNIANSQTAGYARRSVHLSEAPGGGDTALYRASIRPGGVLVAGIGRSVDQWLIDDARTAGSEASQTGVRTSWLQATERALDDGDAGVGASMTAFFGVADRLASDPHNTALRSNFLQSADDIASAFRRSASQLESISSGLETETAKAADLLNSDLLALKRVNDGLNASRDGSTNQAALLDERDRVIDSISGLVSVTAHYNEKGAATIRANGPGNETLLDGAVVAAVTHSMAADRMLRFTLSSGGAFVPPAGKLAGLAQAAQHVSDQRSALDTLAMQTAADLNAVHQSGSDPAGNPGAALLEVTGGAATMTLAVVQPADVAAANATSGNGNMLSFARLRGPDGIENNWANLTALQAQAVSSAQAQGAAAGARQEGASAARDDASGVDLDQEAADLLRFQQAYQGAARVLQVARENMQTIMNAL